MGFTSLSSTAIIKHIYCICTYKKLDSWTEAWVAYSTMNSYGLCDRCSIPREGDSFPPVSPNNYRTNLATYPTGTGDKAAGTLRRPFSPIVCWSHEYSCISLLPQLHDMVLY